MHSPVYYRHRHRDCIGAALCDAGNVPLKTDLIKFRLPFHEAGDFLF